CFMSAPLPPSPPGQFLTGHIAEFQRDRLGFMKRCLHECGDVTAVRFGPRRVFLVNHPEPIEEVLVTKSRHFIKPFALRLNPLGRGNGLLTSEGDFWRRRRRLTQPAFVRSRWAAYAPAMVAATQRVLAEWKPGETREMATEMSRITLDIAAQTLFGGDVHDRAKKVRGALQFMQESFLTRFS